MAEFQGTLRVVGHYGSDLDASLKVDDNRLVVVAGSQAIGDWPLEELSVVRERDGFHLKVEDGELVLALVDEDGFEQAITPKSPKRRRRREPKAPPLGRAPAPAKPARAPKPKREPWLKPHLAKLPPWTKWAALGLIPLAVLSFFFHTVVVIVLLLAGGLLLLAGTFTMVDLETASYLPHSITPTALLMGGLSLVLLGFVVGILD